ncbi:MAG: DNA-binding transcriptional regulator [Pirellulales bacterium]|nr:DNA-binding transcriptional regulator [Pirellulales bacterium]
MPPRKPVHVALMFPPRITHFERSTEGIADFARQHGGWALLTRPDTSASLASLEGWNGDGVIALIDTEAEAQAARRLKVPVVNLSGALRESGIPRVTVDNEAVGRLAAEHLLDCGYRRFAFYGTENLWYVEQRCEGFSRRVEEAGLPCVTFFAAGNPTGAQMWHHGQDELERWLAALETPIGVTACTDHRARMVSEACARLGLKIPGDVGILGVDNDELVCEFCISPLSSVSRSNHHVGFQAAALLARLMENGIRHAPDVLIPPDGVVQRQSTDIVAVDDPNVAAAVRFIRENLHKPFGVKLITAQLTVSRRSLEQGFRAQLGCTPYAYLCRQRIDRAKQMLGCPTRPKISQIARACGFNNPLQFRRAFARATGITPQAYRRSTR